MTDPAEPVRQQHSTRPFYTISEGRCCTIEEFISDSDSGEDN